MSQEKVIGFIEFQKKFSSEELCLKYLFGKRFPNGFICPICGCRECYQIASRSLYQCKECRHQTSAMSGTIMHRSHLTLTVWFWAIYLVSKDKRGYSAAQLAKELDLSYKTSWYLLHRIRSAMSQQESKYYLSGIVELDDTYFGTAGRGGKRGRGTSKTKVVVAVSKTVEGKPKSIKMQVVSNLKGRTIRRFATEKVLPGTTIETDAFHSYRKPLSENFIHDFKVFDPAAGTLRWLHTMIGNAKAFVTGTFHGLDGKCLQCYLDEFCYRFNRRYQNDIFSCLLNAVANSSPFNLAELKG